MSRAGCLGALLCLFALACIGLAGFCIGYLFAP
jgi:hypothetical protein